MRTAFATLLVCFTVVTAAPRSHAGLVFSISPSTGANSLANNSNNQIIDLFVYDDSGPLPGIEVFQLDLQLTGPAGLNLRETGDGGAADFVGVPTIWDAAMPGGVTESFPVAWDGLAAGAPSQTNGFISNVPGQAATISGSAGAPSFVTRFYVDTTGITDEVATLDILETGNTFAATGLFAQTFKTPGSPSAFTFHIGSPTVVPEPSSFAILGLGLASVVVVRRRRQTKCKSHAT